GLLRAVHEQVAGVDRGGAGVGVVAGQLQVAGVVLGQAAVADHGADGQVVGVGDGDVGVLGHQGAGLDVEGARHAAQVELPLMLAGVMWAALATPDTLPPGVSVRAPVLTLPPVRTRALVEPTPTVLLKPFRSSRPELLTVTTAAVAIWLAASRRTASALPE